MKRYINTKLNKLAKVLAMGLLLTSAGCSEDLLDVEPKNEFLSDNFYISEEQVFSGLVAAYDPMGWSMAYGQWVSHVMFGEIRSDNANAGGDASNNDQPGWQEIDDFLVSNANTIIHPLYRRYYIGIFRSNLVLTQPKIDTEVVRAYQAEAKFLRAYYHFELFKHFGPIPVIEETLTPADVTLTRNTMDEVFESITSDLEEAIPLLPESLTGAQAGRASQGAANALLGKVYLYWADMDNDDIAKFDLAADAFDQVIISGEYELEDDFADLWSFSTENPRESILEIQHSNLWPSDWGWYEGIEGNGIIQLCGIRGLCENHPDYAAGWGFMLPTESLYNHYLTDDTYRRDAGIASEASLEQDMTDAGVDNCGGAIDMSQVNLVDYTGYFQVKYGNWLGYNGNNVNGGDAFLTKDGNTYTIRYADVLLMMAEALHRGSGSDANAMVLIDQVRERAAGPGDNTGSFRTAATVMAEEGLSLQDLIWYERRAELALEGDRWYDLVRSGRVNAALFDADRGANYSDEDLWLPISLTETDVAPNLTTYPDASLF